MLGIIYTYIVLCPTFQAHNTRINTFDYRWINAKLKMANDLLFLFSPSLLCRLFISERVRFRGRPNPTQRCKRFTSDTTASTSTQVVVLPWHYVAEMSTAITLHTSAYYGEYERLLWFITLQFLFAKEHKIFCFRRSYTLVHHSTYYKCEML